MNEKLRERNIESCLAHMGAVHAETKLVENIFVETCKLGCGGSDCKYQDQLSVKGYEQDSVLYLCMYEIMTFGEDKL